KERFRRGGTRKFCRCVVCRIELKPCPRERGAIGMVVPSGRIPSIARRVRWKLSLVGVKTTKCRPAAGFSLCPSTTGRALQKNGLLSVFNTQRSGTSVHLG